MTIICRLALLSGLVLSSPSAAIANIIFDFEDRTFQGWEPANDVFIAPTVGIFGPVDEARYHHAVFGLDDAAIRMSIDLTDVDRLVLDVFTPSYSTLEPVLSVVVRPGNSPPFDFVGAPQPIDYLSNPGQLAISLAHLAGVHEVEIGWSARTVISPPYPEPTVWSPAYIDKITFMKVPEASTVGVLLVVAAFVGI